MSDSSFSYITVIEGERESGREKIENKQEKWGKTKKAQRKKRK